MPRLGKILDALTARYDLPNFPHEANCDARLILLVRETLQSLC